MPDVDESLSDKDERLVAERLTAAGIGHQREPPLITTGKKPDFLIETPTRFWLEVKSIGDSVEWSAVLKRYDHIRSLSHDLPEHWHANFGVSEQTTSQHIAVLKRTLKKAEYFDKYEVVACVLTGGETSLAQLSANVGGKRGLVLCNAYPEKCALPFIFDQEYPRGAVSVRTPDGRTLDRQAFDVFSSGDPDTFVILTLANPTHAGWSLCHAHGAATCKIVDRTVDHLSDANRKMRNAQTYVDAPGVVIATVRSKADFAQLAWACAGRPIVGFERDDPDRYVMRYDGPFFQKERNRAISCVLGFDRTFRMRVIPNKFAERPIDRKVLARLIRALRRHQSSSSC